MKIRVIVLPLALLVVLVAGGMLAQLNQSGGPGSTVVAKMEDASGNPITSTSSALDMNIKSGSIGNTAFALNAGSALVGFVMTMPAGCNGSGSSLVVHNTVGVATGAGTSVSATTGCIVEGFVNNITNSAVTFRIADKTGTPIIWLGGNADFSIPANSNFAFGGDGGLGLSGVIMASGITAIAGTASALNLHLVTRE